MSIIIRNEQPSDYREVETVTREAFWNLYVQGCDEHYLAHVMRSHPDFITSLDCVAVDGDQIVGSIMYTRAHIENGAGERIATLSFGPLCVLPSRQRRGVGTALVNHTVDLARKQGEQAIIILGHPHNYCKHGFRSSRDFRIADAEGKYPFGQLVLPLDDRFPPPGTWKLVLSDVYTIDPAAAATFDKQFPVKPKEYRYTQYEFSMACRAYVE